MMKGDENLLFVLELFQNMRRGLIDDFKSKNTDIFIPSFKYERQDESFNIAIGKYFVSWINLHYKCFENMIFEASDSPENHRNLEKIFMQVYLKFIDSINCSSIKGNIMTSKILNDKVKLYEYLLEKSEDIDIKREEIILAYEKDKALFERALRMIKERNE